MSKTELIKALERFLEREELFNATEAVVHIGHYEWDYEKGRLKNCSKEYANLFGMSIEQMMAAGSAREKTLEQIHPDDYERVAAEYRRSSDMDGQINIDYRILRADGEMRWIREVGKVFSSPDSKKRHSLGVLQDVTEQKQYQQDLENRELLAQQAESITDIGHFIYDEKAERYLYISIGFARIHGYSVEEYKYRTQSNEDDISDIHEDDRQRVKDEYIHYMQTLEDCAIEYRLLRADGKIRWLRELGTAHKVENGQILQTLGVIQDITSQKEAESKMLEAQAMLEQKVADRTRELAATVKQLQEEITEREKVSAELKYLADHDALTGLPSLRLCKDRLERSLIESRRNQLMTGVLFVDLDGFKSVNDSYGHDFGDIVLKVTTNRIKAEIRESDTVARIGGDEFIVIMSRLPNLAIVQRVARNLIEQISQTIHINQQEVSVGASIGIALYPDDGTTAEELIRQADRAMYRVKHSGKNNFAFFHAQQLN